MLDRLIREKPNANMITYESIIMNATNKTSLWRDSLTAEKRSKIMNWARESVRSQYDAFVSRRSEVWRLKDEKRLGKLEAKKKREVKCLQEKERLCVKISEIGGLWLEEDQVEEKLNLLSSEKEKRDALKCQLQFRQKILSGVSVLDKKLFHFSEKGINKSVQTLKSNLCVLISQLRKDTTSTFPTTSNSSLSSVLSTNKFEGEKSRLKELLDLEKKKLDVSSPKPKRKKISQLQSLPDISSPLDLLGKRVEHFTFDETGKQKWFDGLIGWFKTSI